MYLVLLISCAQAPLPVNNSYVIYHVPSVFSNKTLQDWDSLVYSINRTANKTYILLWQGVGGKVRYAEEFFDEIQKSKKNIIIRIIGPSISAHGEVICFLPKNVEFASGYVILHNAFTGYDYKGNKKFDDRTTSDLLDECINAGWITKAEKNRIISQRLRLIIYPNHRHVFLPDWR